MKWILKGIGLFSRFCAWTCGFLLIAATVMIAVEVILRKFFAMTIGGADEISSYVLAIICSWSLGYALYSKSHVRIDILYYRLSRWMRIMLDMFALMLFLIYMGTVTYFSYELLHTSIIRRSIANTPLQTPLWIPQSIWFAGIVGFTLIIAALLCALVYYVLKRDLDSAEGIAGTSAVLERTDPESASPGN